MAEMTLQQAQMMAAYMQNPQQGLQLQQQQALAQQMMQQGAQQPDPNAQITGHAVPTNPWGELANFGERLAGAYEQKDANQKLASMMQGSTSGVSDMSGAAPLTGNIMKDTMMAQTNPEGYKAAVALKNAGAIKAAEQQNTIIDVNGHKELGNNFFPAGNNNTGSNNAPIATPQPPQGNPAITPQSPAGTAAINDMYGTPAPATPGANPSQVSPQGNGGAVNIDFNNPAAVKNAEAEATKTGENVADTEKTFNVVNSQLPRALERFEQIRAAIPNASSGEGLTPDSDGTPGWKTRWLNQFGDTKTAKANQMIEQISSQGILPEIGPVIASTGGRGNQFMEKMASSASGIGLPLQPEAKMQAVKNVEDQYVGNMKAQAAVLRQNGRPAPSDAQIDSQVSQMKQRAVAIQHARDAIESGAPKDQVIGRLKGMNIDPGNL